MIPAAASESGPAPGVWETMRETPGAVRAILLATFVNRTAAFLQVFLVLYLVHEGYSPVQAGFALGLHGAGAVAGGMAGGWLADLIGSRYTMLAANGAAGLFIIGVLYAPDYPTVLAAVILVGLCSSAFRPAAAAALATHTPPARYTMVFAMQRLAVNIGTTVGPLLGAALISVSFAALFWVEGVITMAVAVLTTMALADDRVVAEPGEDTPATEPSNGRLDPRYLVFLLGVVLTSIVYVQYLSTLPLFLADAGYPTAVFAALVAVNGLIVMLFELPVTKVTQRWPARPILLVNVALVGVGMAMYGVPLGLLGLVIATIIWSGGEIIGAPTMFAYPAKIAPPERRGRYLGAVNAAAAAAFAIGPPLGTLAWATVGTTVWLLCAVPAIASIIAIHMGTDRRV